MKIKPKKLLRQQRNIPSVLPASHARQQRSCLLLLRPQLADVYGSVFCIRLGRHKTVFVSGWKMVKEAIVTQADSFVDRPYSPMATRIYSGTCGEAARRPVGYSPRLVTSDSLSLSQLACSSATATFGGGSAASPWPPCALSAWPTAPWS